MRRVDSSSHLAVRYSVLVAKLLIDNGSNFVNFSECALTSKGKWSLIGSRRLFAAPPSRRAIVTLVYRRAVKVSPQQMRAAIESLPCENPKLSAVAIASMNERDFALRLERAIARSERAKLIEARAVNADDNG
jgi:hypothetical protein